MSSTTDLLGKDAGLTVLTVLHSPGGSSNCHAVQVTERASAGQAAALSLVSYNGDAGALQVRSTGPYMQAYDGSNTLKFEVTNAGNVTAAGTLTTTGATTFSSTLAVTGAVTLSSTLAVTGASTLTGNTTVGGTLGVTGATTLSSTLAVTGTSTLTGNVTMTNNATVGGTLGVTGASTFSGQATVSGANFLVSGTGKGYRFRPLGSRLDCEATGSDWILSVFSGTNFDGTQRTYLRLESGTTLAHACGTWIFTDTADSAAVHTIDGTGNKLGFHGATSVAKQTVTGSRGANAALTSLLTALSTLGLVTDSTSA